MLSEYLATFQSKLFKMQWKIHLKFILFTYWYITVQKSYNLLDTTETFQIKLVTNANAYLGNFINI